MKQAFENANMASPHAPYVEDYRWRIELLANRPVDLEETAAAVAAAPTDPVLRCTHALGLLRRQQPAEAFALLQEIDIVPERLSPADQAVAIAVLKANGQTDHAEALLGALDAKLLRKSEIALTGR
jgi:predicted Zn-dependent protease